jgi:hypothetical protein
MTATALLFGSSALGGFFDNIPYVATMAPVVENLVAEAGDPAAGQALWWSFALGADFGGNGTAMAASANVVAIGIAARTGLPDQLLAVHPLRDRHHRAEHDAGVGLRVAPLFPVVSSGAASPSARGPVRSASRQVHCPVVRQARRPSCT